MGIAYNTSIVKNGLVLHLDAANVKSYPGSGTTWTDLSGNGNHATLVNGPTFDSGNKGSLVFDGTNDYASTNNPSTLSNFTISLWINILSFSGERQLFVNLGDAFGITTYNGKYMVYNGAINAGSSIVTNVWKNVLVTTSGTSVSLYLDSVLDASWSTGRALSAGEMCFCAFNANSRQLNANLSLAAIYNRALSASEIKQNFEALRGRYGI